MQKQQYPGLFKDNPVMTETYDKQVLELSDGLNSVKLYVPNDIYEHANNGK